MTRATCLAACLALLAAPLSAQMAVEARAAELRVLDKVTGVVRDVEVAVGSSQAIGLLQIDVLGCRYPEANPNGDAYADLRITYGDEGTEVFAGWMIASAPALNALDHPRYDVWALRCMTS